MIIQEKFEEDNEQYLKTYSDISVYIKNQYDQMFVEAIDPYRFKDERIYTETNISIEIQDIPINNERPFPL